MTSKVFDAILSVVDDGSRGILKLDQNLKGLGTTALATESELKATGRAAIVVGDDMKMNNMERMWTQISEGAVMARERVGGVAERFAAMGETVVEMLPMMAAFGAAASLGGIVESVHSTAEMAEALTVAATKAGVTTQQLQGLEFVATQVGVPTDRLVNSMGKLNRVIGDSMRGKNKDAAALFHKLGIDLKGAHGHAKDAADVLPKLEDAFKNIVDPAARATMAAALFGKAGADMLPFLDLGSKKINEIQKRFNTFGYTLTDQDKAGLDEFNKSWKDLGTAVGGFMDEVGAKLGPVLAPGIEGMALWIAHNRTWIAQDMAGAVGHVEAAVKDVASAFKTAEGIFKKFEPPAIEAWDQFKGEMDAIWKGAASTFDSYMGDVLAGLAQIQKFEDWVNSKDTGPKKNTRFVGVDDQRRTPDALNAHHGGGQQDDNGVGWWQQNVFVPIANARTPRDDTMNPGRYFNMAPDSKIEVSVQFGNAPPGTQVTTKTTGEALAPARGRLGYNSMSGHQ